MKPTWTKRYGPADPAKAHQFEIQPIIVQNDRFKEYQRFLEHIQDIYFRPRQESVIVVDDKADSLTCQLAAILSRP